MGLVNIRNLSSLVNKVYDKSLMAATFSQAAKFNFSQFDNHLKAAFLAKTAKEFQIENILADDSYETLLTDLDVVIERSLKKDGEEEIHTVKKKLEELKKIEMNLIPLKKKSLEGGYDIKKSLKLHSRWSDLKEKKVLLRSLSAIHDKAAEDGYAFRVASDKKNKDTIKYYLMTLIISLVLSIAISLSIALLIIKPLFKLEKVCLAVNEGDFDKRANFKRNDEFGQLSRAFDFMLDTIQEKSENLFSLINALPFGLFYVDQKGNLSKEMSPATGEIFPEIGKVTNAGEFFKGHGIKPEQVQKVLDATFSSMLPFKAATGLFPKEMVVQEDKKNKYVELVFEPSFSQNKELSRIIIIAEDVTQRREDQEEKERLFERVERISKVSEDADSFVEFNERVESLFDTSINSYEKGGVDTKEELLIDLKRNLHTLKGLLVLFNFNFCSQYIHESEEKLGMKDYNSSLSLVNKSYSLFKEQARDIQELLGTKEQTQTLPVTIDKIKKLREISSAADEEIKKIIEKLDHYPISYLAKKYAKYIEKTSFQFPDKKIEFLLEESDEITKEVFSRVDDSLMHLINNSLAHGIEDKESRLEKNKDPIGKISLKCFRSHEGFDFVFRDDGNGIDPERVYQSALSKGLVQSKENLSDQAKQELIFKSGFSTQEEASTLSGRGVGMDVVKSEIESLGGQIFLQSEPKQFTEVTLRIPG